MGSGTAYSPIIFAGGYVFTDEETVSALAVRFDSLCVETASGSGSVLVRDTTDRDGAVLSFGLAAWVTFTAALR
jgi:hypothetical protein